MIKLMEAISLIAYDGGYSSADTATRTRAILKAVQGKFTERQITETDTLLNTLSEEDFETVCIGDQDEALFIMQKYTGSDTMNEILEYVFEGEHGL